MRRMGRRGMGCAMSSEGIASGRAVALRTIEAMSPAGRLELLIDMGPPHIVRYDEDTGEPIYRGAGLLTAEQVRELAVRSVDGS